MFGYYFQCISIFFYFVNIIFPSRSFSGSHTLASHTHAISLSVPSYLLLVVCAVQFASAALRQYGVAVSGCGAMRCVDVSCQWRE